MQKKTEKLKKSSVITVNGVLPFNYYGINAGWWFK